MEIQAVYVILDDVGPTRGTVTRIGTLDMRVMPGDKYCRWVGEEPPVKGMRAWHKGSIASAS